MLFLSYFGLNSAQSEHQSHQSTHANVAGIEADMVTQTMRTRLGGKLLLSAKAIEGKGVRGGSGLKPTRSITTKRTSKRILLKILDVLDRSSIQMLYTE